MRERLKKFAVGSIKPALLHGLCTRISQRVVTRSELIRTRAKSSCWKHKYQKVASLDRAIASLDTLNIPWKPWKSLTRNAKWCKSIPTVTTVTSNRRQSYIPGTRRVQFASGNNSLRTLFCPYLLTCTLTDSSTVFHWCRELHASYVD